MPKICKLLKIKADTLWTVCHNNRQPKNFKRPLLGHNQVDMEKNYATIYIYYNTHSSLKQVLSTCIHELLHVKLHYEVKQYRGQKGKFKKEEELIQAIESVIKFCLNAIY